MALLKKDRDIVVLHEKRNAYTQILTTSPSQNFVLPVTKVVQGGNAQELFPAKTIPAPGGPVAPFAPPIQRGGPREDVEPATFGEEPGGGQSIADIIRRLGDS